MSREDDAAIDQVGGTEETSGEPERDAHGDGELTYDPDDEARIRHCSPTCSSSRTGGSLCT